MPLTTLLVVTTRLERRLLTSAWTASENLLTTALVSKGSLSSTLLVEVPVLVSVPFCWSVSLLIMGRSPSWVSLSTHLPKSPPLLLSPTTAFSQPIHSLSTLMLLFCLTMRLSMTSAGAHLTLSVPHTPTLTV
uniref:Uncharacterized protein n=1 Tax=Opuntia streptacantha TaxID=393608 RepID=A0A7C8YCF9_OPUST